jgi:hypothetical protein
MHLLGSQEVQLALGATEVNSSKAIASAINRAFLTCISFTATVCENLPPPSAFEHTGRQLWWWSTTLLRAVLTKLKNSLRELFYFALNQFSNSKS